MVVCYWSRKILSEEISLGPYLRLKWFNKQLSLATQVIQLLLLLVSCYFLHLYSGNNAFYNNFSLLV